MRFQTPETDDDLRNLHNLTGGHPRLSRRILFLAATGIAKDELLDLNTLKNNYCQTLLNAIWLHFRNDETIRKPLCAIVKDPSQQIDPTSRERLEVSGLVSRTEGHLPRVVGLLLESYLRDRC